MCGGDAGRASVTRRSRRSGKVGLGREHSSSGGQERAAPGATVGSGAERAPGMGGTGSPTKVRYHWQNVQRLGVDARRGLALLLFQKDKWRKTVAELETVALREISTTLSSRISVG